MLKLVLEWVETEWRGDVTSLAAMLDDGFVARLNNGSTLNKASWLERYSRGDLVNDTLKWTTERLIRRRRSFLVVGRLQQEGSFRRHGIRDDQQATLCLAMRRGRLRLTAVNLGTAAETVKGSAQRGSGRVIR